MPMAQKNPPNKPLVPPPVKRVITEDKLPKPGDAPLKPPPEKFVWHNLISKIKK
jgi:hypothetical protein